MIVPIPIEDPMIETELRVQRAHTGLQTSKIIIGADIGMILSLLAIWLIGNRVNSQILITSILMAILIIPVALYPYFHRIGKVQTGANLLLISLLTVILVGCGLMPEVIVITGMEYLAAICVASLLLGRRESNWVVVVSAIGYLINLITAQSGFIYRWFSPLDGNLVKWLVPILAEIVLAGLAMIIQSIIKNHDLQFRQARLAGLDVERRAASEREQRKSLEQAKIEIEKRAVMEQKQLEQLAWLIKSIRESANELSSASAEILAATTQQASGATEQSAAITQTTSTVNEVKTISEQSSMRLKDIASASQHTVEVARSGQKAVQEMIESMSQIKERVEAIAENTLALSEQTQQIGEIITTVNEIAAQSNILALNASVEAARAGEHGKGFAVVAMEVRNLAEQSKQATAQVRTILSEIQKATNSTVMATEEGSKGVDAGVQLAAKTYEAIEKLGSAVNEATQVAMQVVAGGQQLQTGIDQVAMAIQQINQVTIQSLASTRQTEKSAQNLNVLAHRLNENVSQYQ